MYIKEEELELSFEECQKKYPNLTKEDYEQAQKDLQEM
jgi:hypothetical protein